MRFNKNEAWSFGKAHRGSDTKIENPGPGNYNTEYRGKSSPKWK